MLKPSSVHLYDPGQLAESKNLSVWKISDADFSQDRKQMMLTQGADVNVFDHDQILGIVRVNPSGNHLLQCVLVSWNGSKRILIEI